jgi:hypothetical protein
MVRTHYDPQSSVQAARTRYFLLNHFGSDGGYDSRWVAFKLGPLPITLPNSGGRVRAVRYHDLHHVLTGYQTDNVGEFEIAAWELAAGCRDYWVAWVLNLAALAAGSLRAPKRTFRAFVRGRACKSLYGEDLERLLARTVGELRAELGLDAAEQRVPTLSDRLEFSVMAAAGVFAGTGLLGIALPLSSLGLVFTGITRLGMENA